MLSTGFGSVVRMSSSRICPCGKQRYFCIPCGGKGVCPCGKVRKQCRECNGNAFCPHQGCNKRKAYCLIHCNEDREPESMCTHFKRKARCVLCGGSELCECGRQRASCPEHGKQCECGRLAYTCPEHGTMFCPCGKRVEVCAEHGGSSLCPCGKRQTMCAEHGGGHCALVATAVIVVSFIVDMAFALNMESGRARHAATTQNNQGSEGRLRAGPRKEGVEGQSCSQA